MTHENHPLPRERPTGLPEPAAERTGFVCRARTRGLAAVLEPRSVALIGASERLDSVGAAVLRNLTDGGFKGPVTPVNLKRDTVLGRAAYARIADVPVVPDLAVICTPARGVPALVRECGEAGVGGVLILSAGFREASTTGAGLEDAVGTELARYPGMRAIGPNCLGLIVPSRNLNASFARTACLPGGVAFLSQSGALCTTLLGWARDEGIGFSHFVSVGNMVDVTIADLLEYLAEQPQTTSVVVYLEGIANGRRLVQAARRCSARKPVLVFKAGRSAAGARAAASHTGAMAGEDAVYEAAFEESGVVRVDRIDDLLGTAALLATGRRPSGRRLAILTNAGGPGVIATDALLTGNGQLAALSAATLAALDSVLPAHWSRGNPVDVIGDAGSERLAAALDHVLRDEGVDAVVVIVTPQAMIDTVAAARAVAAAAGRSSKPVLAAWMVSNEDRGGVAVLHGAGIATYRTPEQAVEAFLYLSEHARLSTTTRADRDQRDDASVSADEGPRAAALSAVRNRRGMLGEQDSKSLLSIYHVPVSRTLTAAAPCEAVALAREVGYPVVLKVVSAQASHKTDVGGVVLDLRSDDAVETAFEQIRSSLLRARPQADFAGVTVQHMLDGSAGIELIIGARRDDTFGPIVLVGAGGIAAEVLRDRAIGLAPLDALAARRLIDSLRIRPLLNPFRGRAALDIDAAAAIMVGMSRMILDLPRLQEVEANPTLVTPTAATVLDARVVLMGSAPSDFSSTLGGS